MEKEPLTKEKADGMKERIKLCVGVIRALESLLEIPQKSSVLKNGECAYLNAFAMAERIEIYLKRI